MSTPPDPPSPQSPAAAPAARPRWNPARQRVFLLALLEHGHVAGAARAAGMSRSSAHRLRLRLGDTPFVRGWDRALAEHTRRLADPFARPPAQPGDAR